MVVFLGLAALAVDIGFIHEKSARVQSAAEAVALAAGYQASQGRHSSYNGEMQAVESATWDLAALNARGCEPPVYEWGSWNATTGFFVPTGSGLRSAVRVTVRTKQPRFFSRIFGEDDFGVVGRATVIWTPYGDVWPLTISSTTDFSPGATIKFGASTTNNRPGNKGWLSFDGDVNAPSLRTYLNGGAYSASDPNPWSSTLGLNQVSTDWYDLLKGSPGAHILIGGTPGLKKTLQSIVESQVNAGAVVLLPIWDSAEGNGRNTLYRVVGLVPVQLVPPYTGLDSIEARVLSDGAFWFSGNQHIPRAFDRWLKPHVNLTMVE